MVYSKSRVKTEQDRALAELLQEQETTQAALKALKALERASQADETQTFNHLQFQKALKIYVNYFQTTEIETISACHERVFQIFDQNYQNLCFQLSQQDSQTLSSHIRSFCDLLGSLVKNAEQAELIKKWQTEFNQPISQKKLKTKKNDAFFYKYLDSSLILSAQKQEKIEEEAGFSPEDDELGDWFVD